MISAFDKQTLTVLRNEFDAAVRQVAQKHGIQIRLGTIRFDSVRATSKIEFVATGTGHTSDPQAAQIAVYKAEFPKYAAAFGLKPEHYGATIKSGRETYKLVGLKPRSPKRPILAQNVADGKIYILTEPSIAPLQSKEHREIFGITVKTVDGQCANDNAFDEKFHPIGQCTRKPTTFRKAGFGKSARSLPYCDFCARLMDESRAEMEAEARANR